MSQPSNWQSVADRINELEKQQQIIHDHNKQQHYTYLDPSKTNRIPNSTLKAFQKNAIQSYFERQQQQQASIRLSKSGGTAKSDELSKLKSSDVKSENLKTNGAALRPKSLNLSIAPPGNLPASSPCASQRSSISNWPISPMIGSSKSDVMMKNDVVKMNMKNSAMSASVSDQQKQQLHVSRGSSKNQSINNGGNKLFTTFCEIKTETYSEHKSKMMENGSMENLLPPPLPKKNGILRR